MQSLICNLTIDPLASTGDGYTILHSTSQRKYRLSRAYEVCSFRSLLTWTVVRMRLFALPLLRTADSRVAFFPP